MQRTCGSAFRSFQGLEIGKIPNPPGLGLSMYNACLRRLILQELGFHGSVRPAAAAGAARGTSTPPTSTNAASEIATPIWNERGWYLNSTVLLPAGSNTPAEQVVCRHHRGRLAVHIGAPARIVGVIEHQQGRRFGFSLDRDMLRLIARNLRRRDRRAAGFGKRTQNACVRRQRTRVT